MSRESTYGSSPKGLAGLLSIGVSGARLDREVVPDTTIRELLRAHLHGVLPTDTAEAETLPLLVGQLCKELSPLPGRSVGEALLAPETDMDTLAAIKCHAKELASGSVSYAERAATTAIGKIPSRSQNPSRGAALLLRPASRRSFAPPFTCRSTG